MTAYLKKSFFQFLHYWIEQKLVVILIPLTDLETLSGGGGGLVFPLQFFSFPDDDTNKFLLGGMITNVVIE